MKGALIRGVGAPIRGFTVCVLWLAAVSSNSTFCPFARSWPLGFRAAIFFFRGFLSHHARRTKIKGTTHSLCLLRLAQLLIPLTLSLRLA